MAFGSSRAADPPPVRRPKMKYPFQPKSTAHLKPGQFWSVPLTDGRFGCGRVLQLGGALIPVKSRAFFGGLQAWVGEIPPSAETPLGSEFVRYGVIHVRAVSFANGAILGERSLEVDGIQLPECLSAVGGPGTLVLKGAE